MVRGRVKVEKRQGGEGQVRGNNKQLTSSPSTTASFSNPRFSFALSPSTFGSGVLGFFLLLGFSCDPSGVPCSL